MVGGLGTPVVQAIGAATIVKNLVTATGSVYHGRAPFGALLLTSRTDDDSWLVGMAAFVAPRHT